jgi:hypothetical protein
VERRGGALAYFAAYDIHHARVTGTIAGKTGIDPFTACSTEPTHPIRPRQLRPQPDLRRTNELND